MDDLNCCLSHIVHLCLEACLFLDQLYQFECQLTKFYSSSHARSNEYFSILERFTIVINDLNHYHRNYFMKIHSRSFQYLSRTCLTVNYSEEISNNFDEDLNEFLNAPKKYYRDIFYYVHQLSITCSLCMQYRRLCTNVELTDRFVYIRSDLTINLRRLNEEIQYLLNEINSNFQQISIKSNCHRKEKILISDLSRTICLWFILILAIGCYLIWSMEHEDQPPKNTWFL